jgi:hypothetical protein
MRNRSYFRGGRDRTEGDFFNSSKALSIPRGISIGDVVEYNHSMLGQDAPKEYWKKGELVGLAFRDTVYQVKDLESEEIDNTITIRSTK